MIIWLTDLDVTSKIPFPGITIHGYHFRRTIFQLQNVHWFFLFFHYTFKICLILYSFTLTFQFRNHYPVTSISCSLRNEVKFLNFKQFYCNSCITPFKILHCNTLQICIENKINYESSLHLNKYQNSRKFVVNNFCSNVF